MRWKSASLELSHFIPQRIMERSEGCKFQCYISATLNDHLAYVNRLIVQFNRDRNTRVLSRTGTPEQNSALVLKVINNPKKSVEDMSISLNLSCRTVSRYLHCIGFCNTVAKNELWLKKLKSKRRFNLPKEMSSKIENIWKHAIFPMNRSTVSLVLADGNRCDVVL